MIRRRRRTHLLRLLLLLLLFFIINSISFTLYFLLSPPPPSPPTHPQTHHHPLKPWPILPSSLPWIPSSAPFRSCEAHFGNGFTRRLHLLRPISDGKGGFFRCLHSQTLNSSVCEMGMVRMDPARIRMSVGGEAVESVIGRSEEEELPIFGEGAFVVDGGGSEGRRVVEGGILERFAPKGDVERHTMRELMESVRVGVIDCGQWIEEPTLLVTRFEYANLFHTITDWYSAYVSSRVTNLTGRPHLVFVDGHCKAPLEETWEALFSSVRYAKSFTSPVCFRHVILSPLGYETALFKGLSETIKCEGGLANDLLESPNYHKTARLTEFGEMLRSAFDLPKDEHHILKPASGHNVLFIRREDYLAHPRHNGKVESRLSNEEEVYDALKIWASDHSKCEVNLVNGRFAHMKMKEQLRAIQEASVIIGAHGAGLTHIISASLNAVVLEIISSHYRRPHFKLISQWRGLKYRAINLKGSYVKPSKVIDELSNIMRNLGC